MSHSAATAHAPTHFDDHGHKDHGHTIVSLFTLRFVLTTLLFLTLLTVGAAKCEEWIATAWNVEIPVAVNVTVALSIAVVKTTLVVLFFMQLKYDNPLNSMVFIFTLMTVACFLGFTALDLGNRATIDRFKNQYVREGGLGLTTPMLKDKNVAEKVAADLPITEQARLAGIVTHRNVELAAHAHAAHEHAVSDPNHSRPIHELTLPDLVPEGEEAPPADGHDAEPAAH